MRFSEYEKWQLENHEVLRSVDDKLGELSVAAHNAKLIDDKIAAIEACILFFEEYKGDSYKRGKYYKRYFDEMWMHCHNSKNPDYCFVDPLKAELNRLKENYDMLKEKECRHENCSAGLSDQLRDFLRKNNSILQREVYRNFDESVKSDIQEILYFWSKEGIIRRTKSGSTYQIEFIEREGPQDNGAKN